MSGFRISQARGLVQAFEETRAEVDAGAPEAIRSVKPGGLLTLLTEEELRLENRHHQGLRLEHCDGDWVESGIPDRHRR